MKDFRNRIDLSIGEKGGETLEDIYYEGDHILEYHALHDIFLEIDLHCKFFLIINSFPNW